jgi:cullin 3
MQNPRLHDKMKIRTFPSHVDERHVDTTWRLLKKAIVDILNKNNSGLSFEELYRNAYTMVLHKHGEKLYDGLKEAVNSHLVDRVRPIVLDAVDTNFLSKLIEFWTDHTVAMVMIRDIVMYLDRVFVQQQRRDLQNVYNLGLQLFRDQIISVAVVNDHLKATMLNMIELERKKEQIEWTHLKSACNMLLLLGLGNRSFYENQFENLFLRESAEYYRAAGQKFLAENSASVFVRKVNECLNDEKERADRYLDGTTEKKIMEVLHQELIIAHMQTVVDMENSGLVYMLNNDCIEDLKLLYGLLKRAPAGITTMTDSMSKFLRSRGEALVKVNEAAGPANPVTYIQNLLDLKDQFDHFLKNAFHDDKDFKNKIQADFEYFLNLNTKSPEFLSLYIDDKLKKGLKTMNEGDTDNVLDKAMVLFRFLQEKDVFERYYKQHLAKRLLFAKSSSDDAEKSMISKLKTECGAHFTQKLEGMFKDMEASNTLMNQYKDIDHGQDIDLTAKVLTKVYWPTSEVKMCILPSSAENAFKRFKEFYLHKHTGRVLTLNPCLGFADVKATFYKKAEGSNSLKEETKILTVSTYIMCVLMRFNEADTFTYKQLLEDTQVPDRDLKRALMSMAMGKQAQRILSRVGTSREIEEDDVFSVNDTFSSKLIRIRIQMVSAKAGESEPERKETRAKVDDDRKHEIEAAVVRVMKSRQRLFHNELITEVTKQLQPRFMPDPIVIKKRIESLMEREYLKRDENDSRVYRYVA